MRNRTGWIFSLAGMMVLSGHARLRAQVVDKPQQESKAIKAMVEDSISWYQVFSDANAPEAMAPQRVLRWQNGTRGTQESDGIFVLWVHHGRPEASASIFPFEGSIHYELVSLSRGSKLVAREDSRVIWSPATPGVAFKDIPGAPAPADTPAARLKQMKGLADRFKVAITGWKADKSDREELRLRKLAYRIFLRNSSTEDYFASGGRNVGFTTTSPSPRNRSRNTRMCVTKSSGTATVGMKKVARNWSGLIPTPIRP
jgi:hypothetical protein